MSKPTIPAYYSKWINELIAVLENNPNGITAQKIKKELPHFETSRIIRLLVEKQRNDLRYKQIIVSGNFGYKIANNKADVKDFLMRYNKQALEIEKTTQQIIKRAKNRGLIDE